MLGSGFAVISLGAAVHAGWNAIIKAVDDNLLTMSMVAACARITSLALIA